MLLNEIQKSKWLNKSAKRLWRWNSSGKWNYSARGLKWQGSRTWSKHYAWFEWGQTPLNQRLPKLRWFKRYYKLVQEFIPVNLGKIESDDRISAGSEVNKEILLNCWYIKNVDIKVKVLWNWDFTKSLNFAGIEKYSQTAKQKIETAGWKII